MAFQGNERNGSPSIIPDDLRLFDPTDIRKVFDYLEKTFHLNRDWYKDFRKELLKVERGMSEQEFFFRYCRQHIDPSLQRILRRKDSVIFALARWIIRDKIREKKKQENFLRNFYEGDEWRGRAKA
jgi:hypothetical protein